MSRFKLLEAKDKIIATEFSELTTESQWFLSDIS